MLHEPLLGSDAYKNFESGSVGCTSLAKSATLKITVWSTNCSTKCIFDIYL